MSSNELLARVDGAVSLESDDAAIRISAEYEPQAGPVRRSSRPPTGIGKAAVTTSRNGGTATGTP
jgi:hypothetical protein